MKVARDWKNFEVISTGFGEKLERWNSVLLLRPDPQVIWECGENLADTKGLNARYIRSSKGGGEWKTLKKFEAEWQVSWKNLNFWVKPMGFKHTGIFPEQAVNWQIMQDLIASAGTPIRVLNLFGYTGCASVALAAAGASVTHVDSAKNMVERCRENIALNNLADREVRYIVDDCNKFVMREIKRGKTYDAILMDPPSYGRGPNGEMWKIEENLLPLVKNCTKIMSDKPLFFLINSYTTGLQPTAIKNIILSAFASENSKIVPMVECYEVGLETGSNGVVLPCGCSAIARFNDEEK